MIRKLSDWLVEGWNADNAEKHDRRWYVSNAVTAFGCPYYSGSGSNRSISTTWPGYMRSVDRRVQLSKSSCII